MAKQTKLEQSVSIIENAIKEIEKIERTVDKTQKGFKNLPDHRIGALLGRLRQITNDTLYKPKRVFSTEFTPNVYADTVEVAAPVRVKKPKVQKPEGVVIANLNDLDKK